jgi:hypothetical protein
MQTDGEYKFLRAKRGSRYRQLFFGRIRAEVLYRETVGRDSLTPEEVAREYNVPVEAVLEAIDYCVKNKALLDAERAREEAEIKAAGRDRWPYAAKATPADA